MFQMKHYYKQKVVHAQLLIKTNTLNIARQVFHIHKIRLEVRTIQSGEFKILIQLDLEDIFTGQSFGQLLDPSNQQEISSQN